MATYNHSLTRTIYNLLMCCTFSCNAGFFFGLSFHEGFSDLKFNTGYGKQFENGVTVGGTISYDENNGWNGKSFAQLNKEIAKDTYLSGVVSYNISTQELNGQPVAWTSDPTNVTKNAKVIAVNTGITTLKGVYLGFQRERLKKHKLEERKQEVIDRIEQISKKESFLLEAVTHKMLNNLQTLKPIVSNERFNAHVSKTIQLHKTWLCAAPTNQREIIYENIVKIKKIAPQHTPQCDAILSWLNLNGEHYAT